jgi:branched-chain amino acid transport system substrate-binding protein
MAYDATQAIIAGLQQKQTRQGLQQVLGSREFTAQGENGEIKFDYDSGDRLGTPVLVTVSNKNFKSIPVK